MFRQATVEDVSHNRITKRHGRIVVVTRYYPRFLKKNLIDAYQSVLAPPKTLLHEFKEKEAELGDHDAAFTAIDYESKFNLQPEALPVLQELATEAVKNHVFLVCHCSIGQYCHRELLLLLAEDRFGSKVQKVSHSYETFKKRLSEIGR